MISDFLSVTSLVALVLLLTRAVRSGSVRQHPFFYSYLAYMLLEMMVGLSLLRFFPTLYAGVFWFSFAIWQIVEFAVLIEASDHIFENYPAIRFLGRTLCAGVIIIFGALYIIPGFGQTANSSNMILELAKRSCLTKAALVLVLLVVTRFFNLKLGKSISGILLGFSVYLGMNIANFELARAYGQAVYAPFLRVLGPASWTLGLLVWVVALWNYAPAVLSPARPDGAGGAARPLGSELARFNDTLTKILQK